jgi:polysaccharide deacetylase family protein (PEP-CTERM system associated)
MSPPRLAVTIDLEFFDTVFLFRGRNQHVPEGVEEIGVDGVAFIADLLEDHGCRGTFFVLGEVAEQRPELIADLASRGHEIASHGYSKAHPDLRTMDREAVSEEVVPAREILEDVTGQEIVGYRAPAFAMDEDVLSVVRDAGHEYDSSLVPSRRIPGFYGTADAPRHPFPAEEWYGVDGITEFPVTVAPYVRLPLSGAWLRLLGRRYALWGLSKAMETGAPLTTYIHPWEFADVPNFDAVPRRVPWRTGAYTRQTFEAIVERYADRIAPMSEVLAHDDADDVSEVTEQ